MRLFPRPQRQNVPRTIEEEGTVTLGLTNIDAAHASFSFFLFLLFLKDKKVRKRHFLPLITVLNSRKKWLSCC